MKIHNNEGLNENQDLIDRIEDLVTQPEPDLDRLYDLTNEIIGFDWPSGRVERGKVMELRQAGRLDLLRHLEEALNSRANKENDPVIQEMLKGVQEKVHSTIEEVQGVFDAASKLPPNPIHATEVRNTWNTANDALKRRVISDSSG